MQQITLAHEPVELYKILKFECLVDGGGEAKIAIVEGWVSVNEQVVTQKRKKIYAGDILSFNGEDYQIVLAPGAASADMDKAESQPVRQSATAKPKAKKRSAIKF